MAKKSKTLYSIYSINICTDDVLREMALTNRKGKEREQGDYDNTDWLLNGIAKIPRISLLSINSRVEVLVTVPIINQS